MHDENQNTGPAEGEEEAFHEDAAARAFEDAKRGFELTVTDKEGKETIIPLAGYSPSRKLAANKMGMTYPYIGESEFDRLLQFGGYAGCLEDTIILMWLCSLPDNDPARKAWTPDAAAKRPAQAKLEAIAWAARMDMVDVEKPNFVNAFGVFFAIQNGMTASEFRLQSTPAATGDASPKV